MQLENLVVACFPATLNHDVLRQRPEPKAQELSVRHVEPSMGMAGRFWMSLMGLQPV